eukprot:TRINITY_DN12774_c0_g1_i1.p1 TRINITY_DN12774_c0_g1~~TRINITY_DN12774_c0_g1_i1.p1  ORF type:complete len:275 (-),score=68.55 TRINITY_DN12774_c0_g1_i1:69-893(-)
MEAASPKPSWGDIEEAEGDMTGTKVYETNADENGTKIRTVVDYTTNDDGKITKRVRKYKIYKRKTKISRAVEARKKWAKFGAASRADEDDNVTMLGEEVEIETTAKKQKEREAEARQLYLDEKVGKEKVADWQSKASRLSAKSWDDITGGGRKEEGKDGAGAEPVADNIFRPRSVREGRTGGPGGRSERSDDTTIRVTNLSEQTQEDDLRELCRKFGPIQRVYLARDRDGESRGFAFVTFVYAEDAAKAITGLQGFGYDHLILNVEWAKPSKPF